MARLSVARQREIINGLPKSKIAIVKKHCRSCEMKGEGIMDILKSVKKALGPIVAKVGPTVMKELVLPLLKKKIGLGLSPAGNGLKLAGQGNITAVSGQGLNLAGGKKRNVKTVKSISSNPWMAHVKKVKGQNPKLKFSEVLKLASKSYKK